MSQHQPPHQGYPGPPQNMDQQHPSHGGETTGARPAGSHNIKKPMPLGFTAGGGLLVGVVAGLALISGGGDASEAQASKEAKGPVVATVTDGDLAPEGTKPAATAGADTTASGTAASGTAASETTAPTTPAAETRPGTDPVTATEAGATGTDPVVDTTPVPVVIPDPPTPDPVPEPTSVDLEFKVTGLEDGVQATITLDDEVVPGTSTGFTIAAGKTKQRAKLVVRAKGYRAFRKTLNVSSDMSIDIAMRKKPVGGGGKKPGGSGPGGLLDL